MFPVKWIGLALLLVACSLLIAQEPAKAPPPLKKGAKMPASFQSFNINGPSKGRPSCLVTRAALAPAMLIFAKEPEEGKDEVLKDLLKQLDEVVAEFEERNFTVGVIFLSPDGRDSTNNAQAANVAELTKDVEKDAAESAKRVEEQAKKLIEETLNREKLVARLTKRAEPFKNVVLAYHPPEAPKGYKLDGMADLTVIFYERLTIERIYTFAPGKLQDDDVKTVVKYLREVLPLQKKSVEEK